MSLPPVRMRHEVLRGYRKGTTARKVKNHRIGVNAIPTCSSARPSPPEFCKRLNVFLGYSLEFLWTESGCRISISKNLIIEDLNALLTPSAGIRQRRFAKACRKKQDRLSIATRRIFREAGLSRVWAYNPFMEAGLITYDRVDYVAKEPGRHLQLGLGNKRTAFAATYTISPSTARASRPMPKRRMFFIAGLYETNDFTFEKLAAWLRDNVEPTSP